MDNREVVALKELCTDVDNTIRRKTPVFSLKSFQVQRSLATRSQMSLADADAAELGGAGAGGQGGPAGGVPRPVLAAVAHSKKRRSESELLR